MMILHRRPGRETLSQARDSPEREINQEKRVAVPVAIGMELKFCVYVEPDTLQISCA